MVILKSMSMDKFNIAVRISENLSKYSGHTAFHIKGKSFTYEHLQNRISAIQKFLLHQIPSWEEYIGVVCKDHLDTYASICALWFSGKVFVPLNPLNPPERNAEIKKRINLQHILCPGEASGLDEQTKSISTDTISLHETGDIVTVTDTSCDQDAYVLFTSGSTGRPKGVRISRKNLDSFFGSYLSFYPGYDENDRFLQIYDLSFDGSVPCYLVPLCTGASVYTVPQDEIKYLYALKLITDHRLTILKMTPSTLKYLKPYFNRISLPDVRVCIFGGEALPAELTEEWMKCVPNALIQNVYGPTEATIDALMYNFNSGNSSGKLMNGIISLGHGFGDFKYAVIDPAGNPVKTGDTGELCLNGNQVMSGYWDDEQKTSGVFIELRQGKQIMKYYRTGDLVSADNEGFFYFHGRIDNQVQVQGFRVEPGEIEKHARDITGIHDLAAVPFSNTNGNIGIALFIAGEEGDQETVLNYLNGKVPKYMVPSKIKFLRDLPRLSSGKTDRKKLSELASEYGNS